MMKAMKRFLLLLSCSGALLSGMDLQGVRAVYVMPMSHAMDQFLANRLAEEHIFQVVSDPKRADAIFTDRIGDALNSALDEIAPAPKPSDAQSKDGGKEQPRTTKLDNPALSSTFGRGKGTFFLVDAKSRSVLWSTFAAPGSSDASHLDRTASDIVSRLTRDLKKQ
jgi:hypothetical protein